MCTYVSPRTYLESVRPIARELRKAMQARATRRALVPSNVLTSDSWLVLSACPSHPGLSLSVYLVVSLLLLPSPLDNVHTRSPSFVLFLVASFSLLIFDADVLRPRRSSSLLLSRPGTTILICDLSVRIRLLLLPITNLSTFLLLFLLKCSPSRMIRPCLPINVAPIAPV